MPVVNPVQFAVRAREVGQELTMLARLTRDLPGWLRTPFSLEEGGERVRQGIVDR